MAQYGFLHVVVYRYASTRAPVLTIRPMRLLDAQPELSNTSPGGVAASGPASSAEPMRWRPRDDRPTPSSVRAGTRAPLASSRPRKTQSSSWRSRWPSRRRRPSSARTGCGAAPAVPQPPPPPPRPRPLCPPAPPACRSRPPPPSPRRSIALLPAAAAAGCCALAAKRLVRPAVALPPNPDPNPNLYPNPDPNPNPDLNPNPNQVALPRRAAASCLPSSTAAPSAG